jgi:hypothetical protein
MLTQRSRRGAEDLQKGVVASASEEKTLVVVVLLVVLRLISQELVCVLFGRSS